MVVKFPPMGSEEEKYDLFLDAVGGKSEPAIYHYYADGVKYIISKFSEKESFDIIYKRFPLYDTEGISHPTPSDEYKQLPFSVSLDKMLVTNGNDEFELNKWEDFNANRQYFSFTNNSKMFIIYRLYDRLYASSEFYLLTTIDLSTLNL